MAKVNKEGCIQPEDLGYEYDEKKGHVVIDLKTDRRVIVTDCPHNAPNKRFIAITDKNRVLCNTDSGAEVGLSTLNFFKIVREGKGDNI